MPCKGCKFPSLVEQVKNVSLGLFNVMTHAYKTGEVLAKESIVRDRIKLCEGCEFLHNNRCSECGCFIALKAGLKSEKCPLNRW